MVVFLLNLCCGLSALRVLQEVLREGYGERNGVVEAKEILGVGVRKVVLVK